MDLPIYIPYYEKLGIDSQKFEDNYTPNKNNPVSKALESINCSLEGLLKLIQDPDFDVKKIQKLMDTFKSNYDYLDNLKNDPHGETMYHGLDFWAEMRKDFIEYGGNKALNAEYN